MQSQMLRERAALQGLNMKFISWNVNGIRACVKKGLLEFIKEEGADFYLLQEIKSKEVPVVDGYEAIVFPAEKAGYSGTLIYSKHKPLSITKGIGAAEFDREGRVITMEFEGFFLIDVYFPHSSRDLSRLNFKLAFDKAFECFCEELEKKKPIIIGGDLNVAHHEIDLANPKPNMKNAGFTQQERDWFDSFLEKGRADTFRYFCPDKAGAYTWWTWRNNARKRNIGWRVDYFVVSKNIKPRLNSAGILDGVFGADHCPISLEIQKPQ